MDQKNTFREPYAAPGKEDGTEKFASTLHLPGATPSKKADGHKNGGKKQRHAEAPAAIPTQDRLSDLVKHFNNRRHA